MVSGRSMLKLVGSALLIIFIGPASGFAVLSQAAELLHNGETINQQLHMSEFEETPPDDILRDNGLRLPPKELADRYIEGQHALEISLSAFIPFLFSNNAHALQDILKALPFRYSIDPHFKSAQTRCTVVIRHKRSAFELLGIWPLHLDVTIWKDLVRVSHSPKPRVGGIFFRLMRGCLIFSRDPTLVRYNHCC